MKYETKQKLSTWYDKNYKLVLLFPVLLTILSLAYIGYFYAQNKDIMYKDVSLSGGTLITLNGDFDTKEVENLLKQKFEDVNFRKLTDLSTGKTLAFVIESSAKPEEIQTVLESAGIFLNDKNSSVEFTGPSLSSNFYRQLMISLAISFILMSFVIFFLFRTFIPSIAVIFAVFADIVMPLALLNFLGVTISSAGIAAFLMLIGYSVDTDILLTTRVLKKTEGSVNSKILSSFKTGILMTGTALAAALPVFFMMSGLPQSFKQIFLILSLGLFADIINTWLTNAAIIKWYCDRKGIR